MVVRTGTRAVLVLRRVGRLAERSETREAIADWVSPSAARHDSRWRTRRDPHDETPGCHHDSNIDQRM
ncbi:hypothetical protein AOB60_03665 [Streptomyces noursei]|uniref:Uncharacterized protein n=1 Tax=Streptomyces noursei TaxID=1971 RepID=A0A2N8PGF7_STRNR|nr:hypothetical protein AOB60_03665 [Streptomyces noursei]